MTFSPYMFAAWYPKISKFLRSKSIMSQLSNALSNVLLRPLDQNLYHFEIQKYHCQSSSLEGIICWMNHGKVSVSVVVFQRYYGYPGRFSNFFRFPKKALFLLYTFSFKIRKFETFEHFQWKIDFTVNTLNPRTSKLFIIGSKRFVYVSIGKQI